MDFFDFSPTIYLNCAYQGPFPLSTAARIRESCDLKCHPDRLGEREYFELPERVRGRLARLVGAEPEEIALTNSATQGIGLAATGLNLAPGDEVVVASTNFPSNLFTWLHLRRRDVRVSVVEPREGYVTAQDVAAALTPRTRILALDWVGYTTGARLDLAALGELAHRQGALFLVDGSQGVGAWELNVHDLPVDILVVAAYKWLLGPYGTGFAYISWKAQDVLDLEVVNWMSAQGSENFDSLPIEELTLPKAARVFDVPETASFLNLHALDASLEYIERVGVQAVTSHATYLLDRLLEGLRGQAYALSAAAEPARRSTILGFRAGSLEATQGLHERLEREHISVSLRHGMIRVSPHLYNDESDIDALLSVTARLASAQDLK